MPVSPDKDEQRPLDQIPDNTSINKIDNSVFEQEEQAEITTPEQLFDTYPPIRMLFEDQPHTYWISADGDRWIKPRQLLILLEQKDGIQSEKRLVRGWLAHHNANVRIEGVPEGAVSRNGMWNEPYALAVLMRIGRRRSGYNIKYQFRTHISPDELLEASSRKNKNKETSRSPVLSVNEIPYRKGRLRSNGHKVHTSPVDSDDETDDSIWLDPVIIRLLQRDDLTGIYFRDAKETPLLSAQEETDLAKTIEHGVEAGKELLQGNVPPKRREGLQKIIDGGFAAKGHLIKANTRLVVDIAKKYRGRGVEFLDLIQEGNIGLIRAQKKFNWRLGHKFSTYATWWIRQAVTRSIPDTGRTIRIPVHMHDQLKTFWYLYNEMRQSLGRDPTVEELASSLDLSLKKVTALIQASKQTVSLDAPVDDDEDLLFGDFIQDTTDIQSTVISNLTQEEIQDILSGLPLREAKILKLRLGLDGGECLTLEGVGQKMGVTRERIRQIENKALRRLRNPSVRWRLTGD
jgi:RNA polymerase primary sigma factor